MAQTNAVALLIMLSMSMLAGALLLWWTWLANRSERIALYGAAAFISAAAGVCLIGMRTTIPLWLSIVGGNLGVVTGGTLLYAGVCLFNGRAFPRIIVLGFPLIYLAAMLFPPIYETAPVRFSISSLLSALAFALTAREVVSLRDGMRSRLPLALALGLQSFMTAVRIPMTVLADPPLFTLVGPWVAGITIESVIFAQVIAYLVISLPKERVELALQHAALSDSLTGLPNRRAFYDSAHQALSLSARRQRCISVISFDLDGFKQLNDSHGHAAGDAALQRFADVLATTLRESDVCGRVGGEEFAAILLETSLADAVLAAERVVTTFGSTPIDLPGGHIHVTVSAGIACCDTGSSRLEDLLGRADRALYEAKQAGRNRVVAAPSRPVETSLAS